MSYGGYKSWKSSSRRNRRSRGSSRRSASQGTDRTFVVVAGLFFLVLILLLAAQTARRISAGVLKHPSPSWNPGEGHYSKPASMAPDRWTKVAAEPVLQKRPQPYNKSSLLPRQSLALEFAYFFE